MLNPSYIDELESMLCLQTKKLLKYKNVRNGNTKGALGVDDLASFQLKPREGITQTVLYPQLIFQKETYKTDDTTNPNGFNQWGFPRTGTRPVTRPG